MMSASGRSIFGIPVTIANAKFDDDDHDPDWVMECEDESDSSEVMSSQESRGRPPELSPFASPIKHDPFQPFQHTERRQLFDASPSKEQTTRRLFTSPSKQNTTRQLFQTSPSKPPVRREFSSSPFPSPFKQPKPPSPYMNAPPLKIRQCFDYPNDSFPALEFQSPEKITDSSYTSPVKTGFGFGPRQTPEKVCYGSYISPVKAPYEDEAMASQKPFTYADLLPQHVEQSEGVTIHRRKRTTSESSGTTDDKTLFFPVLDVRLQDLHDWSTTAKMEGQDVPSSPLKSRLKAHTGHLAEVNGTKVALFRFGTHVFAIRETCPHAGGPLHVGDIEVLPDMSICVRCPWHGWKFDLMNGRARRPLGREEATDIFPVRITGDGSLQIGFDHFDPKLMMDDF